MSAAAILAASLAITAPADKATVASGELRVTLAARRAPAGAHAHLYVDGGAAQEASLSGPTALPGLTPGAHALRAVLCRKDHLALSSAGALALARIWVGPRPDGDAAAAAEERAWPDPNRPILTLVMPAGAANDPPLLDVHVRGATLSRRSYKVRVVVDKRELPLLTEEKPRKLSLSPGRHRITIDLLDKRGTRVGNAVNRTDRTFTVGH